MMNLHQAIAYGKAIGVKYYIYNDKGRLVGGYKTKSAAEESKKRFEAEARRNPFTKVPTRFETAK